jgi:DIM1 family U5 snRNP protein
MAELKHCQSPWDVDRFIVLEQNKVVVMRFSSYELLSAEDAKHDPVAYQNYLSTLQMDDVLVAIAPKVRNFAVVYAVDTSAITEFNAMYELGSGTEPFGLMFFFRNRHMRVDAGTGNNNKINFPMDAEDLIAIIEGVYRAGVRNKSISYSQKQFAFEGAPRQA